MSQRRVLMWAGVLLSLAVFAACSSTNATPSITATTTAAPTLPTSTKPPTVAATPSAVPTLPPSPIPPTPTIASADCQACHQDVFADWHNGAHANTQADVAKELSDERSGQTPDEVINGQDAEDCIACHAPKAVTLAGISSESDALDHFFSTTDGKFTADTKAVNTADWPQINCQTCHNVPDNHQTSQLSFGFFNSQTAQFAPLNDSSQVCGQCHGNLLFSGTDHQVYNAWTQSKHDATQADVAQELASERSGQTPDEVINGQDSENCIACHAPTAVLANGGMSEAQTLDYFFTTTGGQFSATTAIDHADEWPNVSCTACHDPHNPGSPAYFNSATKQYQPMKNADELCGQCHGNLRFPDTDHLSYNINAGTGGMGVPDQQMTPNVACTDCHMYVSSVDGSNSAMLGGHTWAITVKEADGKSTTSCTTCHSGWDTAKSEATIKQLQAEFQALDVKTQTVVDQATKAMEGVSNADLEAKLKEAQFNLSYAESDESGGFHNHTYLMALLNDAQQRTKEILTALGK
jgi:formate-dependent nitrite reductase cytochrome c552 subunit